MALKILWHFRLKLLPWNKDCHPSRLGSRSDRAPASLFSSVSLFLRNVPCSGSWRQCCADRVQATGRIPCNSRIMRWPWLVLPWHRATETILTLYGVNCLLRVPRESGQHPAAVIRLTPEFSKSLGGNFFFQLDYVFFPCTEVLCLLFSIKAASWMTRISYPFALFPQV